MELHVQESGFLISPDMYEKDTADYIFVKFQAGIDKEKARNGIDAEELVELAIKRLETYQSTLPSAENQLALRKFQEGLHWLEHIKKAREATLGF